MRVPPPQNPRQQKIQEQSISAVQALKAVHRLRLSLSLWVRRSWLQVRRRRRKMQRVVAACPHSAFQAGHCHIITIVISLSFHCHNIVTSSSSSYHYHIIVFFIVISSLHQVRWVCTHSAIQSALYLIFSCQKIPAVMFSLFSSNSEEDSSGSSSGQRYFPSHRFLFPNICTTTNRDFEFWLHYFAITPLQLRGYWWNTNMDSGHTSIFYVYQEFKCRYSHIKNSFHAAVHCSVIYGGAIMLRLVIMQRH